MEILCHLVVVGFAQSFAPVLPIGEAFSSAKKAAATSLIINISNIHAAKISNLVNSLCQEWAGTRMDGLGSAKACSLPAP
jgi:hypothetical protein